MSGSEEEDSNERSQNDKNETSKLHTTDVNLLIVKCSACGKQVNHHDPNRVLRHPHLKVLLCKDCLEFYGNGEFSQDEEGDKYCRWCAQGGQVFGCDFCANVFCNDCIRRNFGRGETRKIKDHEWKCYMCDPSQIQEKVDFATRIIDNSKSSQNTQKVKKSKKLNNISIICLKNADFAGDDPYVWLSTACDYLASTASKLSGRVDKMKKRISSKKNTKYLMGKMNEVINAHRNDLKTIQAKLTEKFTEHVHEILSRPTEIYISDNSEKESSSVPKHSKKMDSFKLTSFQGSLEKNVTSLMNNVNSSKKLKSLNSKGLSKSNDQLNGKIEPTDDSQDELMEVTQQEDVIEKQTIPSMDIAENSLDSDGINEIPPTCRSNQLDDSDHEKSSSTKTAFDDVKSSVDVNSTAKAEVLELSDDSDASEATTLPDKMDTRVEDLSSSSKSDSISSDDSITSINDSRPKKVVRKKRLSKVGNMSQYFTQEDLASDDCKPDLEKLMHKDAVVLVERLPESLLLKFECKKNEEELENKEDHLGTSEEIIPETPEEIVSETPEEIVADSSDQELLELERKVKNLSNLKFTKIKPAGNTKARKEKEKVTPVKNKPVNSKNVIFSDPESVLFTSSDDDDERSQNATENQDILSKKILQKSINEVSKKFILEESNSSVSDIFSDSNDFVVTKKKKAKDDSKNKTPKIEDSLEDSEYEDPTIDLDDFVIEKKKSDKLLKVPLSKMTDTKAKDKKEKATTKEKSKKRKRQILYSDDSSKSKKSSSGSKSSGLSSDEEEKPKKKVKRRRRAKTLADSSDEDKKKNDEDEEGGSQSTPGKGRRNIRKVISDRKLNETTIEAQQAEKDRRKRINDRQKLYNQITEPSKDGGTTVTRKMVLEVDSESKEEIVEIHPDLVEKLKPHQVSGVKFMWESTIESLKELENGKPGSGCILAHCMGLGKTLQVITFIHTILTNRLVKKKIKTAMVVCPYNTVLNWSNEFDYWLEDVEGSINIYDLNSVKTTHDRRELLHNWKEDGGVLIIGYNIFTRLAEGKISKTNKKVKTAIFECLCDPGPDVVICDEGHLLKNEASALSKAAGKLRSLRRIVLTGTPLQNNLKEYHCMMQFVKPNLLGTSREFLNRFVNPINNGQYDDSSKYDVKLMKKRVHILHKLLEGCVQRCDYSALTKFLPPKHEFVISVKLSELQIKLYKYYLDNFTRVGGKMDGGKLFQDYQALKNIWTYPWILYPDYYRQEKRRLFKDDDEEDSFIDDGSSSDDEKSDNGDVIQLDDDDAAQPGPSKKKDDSSDDEVIRKYSTRGRPTGEDNNQETLKVKHWWDDFMSEDDKFKIETSGKLTLLVEILRQSEFIGDKVLVFSTSLLTLDMIEDVLEHIDLKAKESPEEGTDIANKWVVNVDYFRMDGSTTVDLRKKWMKLFNDPNNERARLFLISTKAGSLGTNLVGANRVVIMDASWNPSHDVQAIFRVYRFGQIKPVYVYRLLAQGTMEEKIYKRQVTKLSLSCRVVDEQQIDRHFNAAQLSELYLLEVAEEHPTPMVPKDRLLADMLMVYKDWIVDYHEHDSLLQSSTEDDLTEEERQTAWSEYENEKHGIFVNDGAPGMDPGKTYNNYAANGTPEILVDVDEAMKSMIMKLRGDNIGGTEFYSRLLQFLINLLAYLKSRHRVYLVAKQQSIATTGTVPPDTAATLFSIQGSMEKLSAYINSTQKQYSEMMKNSKTYANIYQNARGPTSNIFMRPTVFNMNNVRFTPRPAAPSTNVPRDKPTIVDITSDNVSQSSDVSSSSATNAIPVVTEVDDISTPTETSQKPKAPSSVEIMEID